MAILPVMNLRELTTAEQVVANARAVQARLAASRKIKSPPPVLTDIPKAIAAAPVVVAVVPQHKSPTPPPAPTFHWHGVIHSIRKILQIVGAHYRVPVKDIISDRRQKDIVRARHVCFYLARTLTMYSYPEIGRRMGGRDHTTILHGLRRITEARALDPELDAVLTKLEHKIKSPPAPEPTKSGYWMTG